MRVYLDKTYFIWYFNFSSLMHIKSCLHFTFSALSVSFVQLYDFQNLFAILISPWNELESR